MVVIEHEPNYLEVVRSQSRDRQVAKGWKQIRKVMEIAHSAVNHANPMIQLADLIALTMKKWGMAQARLARGR
jgi:hypothetical protein